MPGIAVQGLRKVHQPQPIAGRARRAQAPALAIHKEQVIRVRERKSIRSRRTDGGTAAQPDGFMTVKSGGLLRQEASGQGRTAEPDLDGAAGLARPGWL